ncbi:hypothetical protein SGA02_11800 [Staphylococcus gallinarum]|uniref:Uncharacterized protein n=1 Tax=Staphylococcus gallinarum TaxID=1293 RepID=A0ABQ0Y1S4_STAGA|nr:hypothetical protein SGA02_11800 [Staphylococcus gallinarum]
MAVVGPIISFLNAIICFLKNFLYMYKNKLFRSLKYNLQKCKLILKMSFIFYKLGNKIYKN